MAKKSITKNYIYNLIYQILILVLPLITTPYISRVLGAKNIGIYSYTYSILSYFLLFGALGVSMYGQREIAYAGNDTEKRKKIFWEIILFRLITVTIALVIYAIFFMRGTQYSVYYRIWAIELIATALEIGWFFQGMEEFKKTVLRNVFVRLISVALIFILVKNENDLIKYITIYAIADLVGNLSLWAYLPKYFKGIKVKNINSFKHFTPIVLLFIPQIAAQIYNMLDRTMIGRMIADKSEVGYYEEAMKVIKVLVTIVSSLGIVMVPRMASVFAKGEQDKVKDYLKKSFQFTFLLGIPMTFGIISISKVFVPIFFGAGFEKTVILMNILSPIVVLCGISSVIGYQFFLPTKRQKEYTISTVIGIIVHFVLNYILIQKYNSIGASVATIISQLSVCAMQIYYVRNDISIKEFLILTYKYLISGIIMFVGCILISKVLGESLKIMVLQILTGIILYFIALLVLKDEYLNMLINRLKLMIGRKK